MSDNSSFTGPSPGCSTRDFISTFFAHREFFKDIDKDHPEADVRLRHLGLRARLANYREWETRQLEHRLDALEAAVNAGKKDADVQEVQDEFKQILELIGEALDKTSRHFEYDCKAAQSPLVEPHFLDKYVRFYNDKPERGLRVPNGELATTYGPIGAAVPKFLTAPRTHESDVFRQLIIEHLMDPFCRGIYFPLQRCFYSIMRWPEPTNSPSLGGRALGAIVNCLECSVAVLFVAGSVTLSANLDSQKNRLLALSFLSLLFPATVIALSPEAQKIFILTASYWAVTVAFIATTYSK